MVFSGAGGGGGDGVESCSIEMDLMNHRLASVICVSCPFNMRYSSVLTVTCPKIDRSTTTDTYRIPTGCLTHENRTNRILTLKKRS